MEREQEMAGVCGALIPTQGTAGDRGSEEGTGLGGRVEGGL